MIPEITLGWRLRIALERADIKADDMARMLDVHRGTITRWTHDIGRPPRRVYLEKWSDITGVAYGWLVGDARDSHERLAAAHAGPTFEGTRPDTPQYRRAVLAA